MTSVAYRNAELKFLYSPQTTSVTRITRPTGPLIFTSSALHSDREPQRLDRAAPFFNRTISTNGAQNELSDMSADNQPTEKQIEAARANGKKSRGPTSETGKRKSAGQNLRHGFLARTVVLPDESRERFDALLSGLVTDLQPAGPIESLLIEKMAVAQWRLLRVWTMEKAIIVNAASQQNSDANALEPSVRDANTLADQSCSTAALSRLEASYDRQFARNLSQLLALREARKTADQ